MFTVETTYRATTEVRKSKFISFIVPISEFSGLQNKLKSEHPKANHVVYAVRYLNEFDQVVENFSDDGEPKGCAGVPSLNVFRGEKLINCAVFIVRYFGGIKLGTGGMARAYALAVKEVLSVATLIVYEKQLEYLFRTSYSEVDKTLFQLKQLSIFQYKRDFGIDGVDWIVRGNEENIKKFKNS